MSAEQMFDAGDTNRAVRALIANSYVGDVGELDHDDLEEIVKIVLTAYRAGQAAAPDGPRTWQLPDGSATFYGIQWTEPNGQVFVVMQDSLQAARDEVAANAGHPKLLNMQVVQSWRTPWVPLSDATPADGQDGDAP